jgi:hypothetical protein
LLNERRTKISLPEEKIEKNVDTHVDQDVETKAVCQTPIVQVDKSAINFDITRKMATFMDFSVILNKKAPDETNLDLFNKTGLGNFAHELWDVSCIGKNS